jgi:hypothetical protein
VFFLKNKPVLKDLIPEGHIDIHSHLLPGIDDGAKPLRTACDLRERFRVWRDRDYHYRISFSMSGIIPMKESHLRK